MRARNSWFHRLFVIASLLLCLACIPTGLFAQMIDDDDDDYGDDSGVPTTTVLVTSQIYQFLSNHQQITGAAVNEIGLLLNGPALLFVQQWNTLSQQEKQALLDQLGNGQVPSMLSGLLSGNGGALTGGLAGHLSGGLLAQMTAGAPQGPAGPTGEPAGFSVWTQGLGSWSDQEKHDGYKGYDTNAAGVLFGIDKQSGPFLVGVSLGAVESSVVADGGGSHTDIDTVQLGLYASYTTPAFYLDGGFSYLTSDIGTSRRLSAVGLTATGGTDSDGFSFFLNGGHVFPMGNWTLTPHLGLEYSFSDTDGYTEQNAGVFAQQFRSTDHHAFLTRLGLRALCPLNNRLQGELRTSWSRDWENERPEVKARFDIPGTTFRTYKGLKPDADRFLLGGGLLWQASDAWSLFLNYDYEFAEDVDSHSLTLGARFSF